MPGAAKFSESTLNDHAYQLLVKEVRDIAIFFMNPEGEIISWNEGAAHMKGYSEKEITGQHYRILFTDEDRKNKKPEEELRQARVKGRFTEEGFRKKKDGSRFRAHVTLTRQLDENNKLLGFFKITRDITERYYREKEAAIRTEEVARLSKLKDEFIGIASHEMKTPLTTVKAYLQLLKDKFTFEKEVKKYITKSYSQVNKLEKLIGELLNASRIGAGNLQLNVSSFDLRALTLDTVENLKQTCSTHRLEVETGKDVMVQADHDRVEQVIVNYLTNAVRYSPEGTEIRVSIKQAGDQAEVCVKDEGKGISDEDQEKVFSRFFRSEEKGRKVGGLGLGLYIVKGIINKHHGDVWVESKLGKGSSFYFTLPIPAEGMRAAK
jgi:PAS domain S-box-containing protein